MRFLSQRCLWILVLLSLTGTARAENCESIRPFEMARVKESKGKQLKIVPFTGPSDVAPVVTVLMKEYLGLAKGLQGVTVSNTDSIGSKNGQVPSLHGDVQRVGEGYVFSFTLDKGENASPEPFHVEGKFLYPDRMNDALVAAVDQITTALKTPLPPKKLLPFVNTTMSGSAYLLYARAVLALGEAPWTGEAVKKAQGLFEQAIEADYNYAPAYLGLAQMLAAESRMQENGPLKNKASAELEKAKALLPPLAELREPAVRWYLEGKAREVCADNRGNP